jgi:hypothetical protein
MRIVHRISLNADESDKCTLATLGVPATIGFTTFELDESDPRWRAVREFAAARRAVDVVLTEASPEELHVAAKLRMEGDWQLGYPQPERDFGYLRATYDLSNYCADCGIGARQVAPFRMLKNPRWGSRGILQLNWVFDEFFAKPEIWDLVFRPLGIGCRPVVAHKTGVPLRDVVQLAFDNIAVAQLNLGGHPFTCCARCGRRKYRPYTRGFFPPFATEVGQAAVLRTQEYFGDGAVAARALIATQSVYTTVREFGTRGVAFTPLAATAVS